MKKTLLFALTVVSAFSLLAQVEPIADMNNQRMGHTATALSSGEILVCGGFDGDSYLNSTEIWDPLEDVWNESEPMNNIRYTAAAIRLDDGRILVTGGWDGNEINHQSTEIYYPDLETWVEGPDMSSGRSFHEMTRLNDGKILITGGFDGSLNVSTADIFDPETDMITEVAEMVNGRSSHTSTLMNDGNVLISGGFNPDLAFQMDECEIYDVETDSWSTVASLATGRDNHGAVLLEDGKILVAGGRVFNASENWFEGLSSFELFNPEFNAWTGSGIMNVGQSYNDMYHFDDRVLCIGSADHTGNMVVTTTSPTSEYNLGVWTTSTDYEAQGRYLSASDKFHEEYIVVCGGEEDSSAEIYFMEEIISVNENNHARAEAFPNPFSDVLNITFDPNYLPESLEVFDARGQILLSQSVLSSNVILSTSDWSPGIYFVKMTFPDGRVWNKKMIGK